MEKLINHEIEGYSFRDYTTYILDCNITRTKLKNNL